MNKLLPVRNQPVNLYLRYLRAPTELDDKMADLGFSAIVYFFLYFFWKNIFGARRKIIFNFKKNELSRESFFKNIFFKIFFKKYFSLRSESIYFIVEIITHRTIAENLKSAILSHNFAGARR